ncbi:hypothetical protein CAG54_00505 [Vibrio sp. V27_P1S3P104]|nr:hypothetical protein [Vibrio sp. V29_P1S30P107]NAX36006.1 hypothetical protein [Vibrio sp. V27_P1S3P104]
MTTSQSQEQTEKSTSSKGLVGKIAQKYGVDPIKFWDTLKATAFKQRNGTAPTNEQMMSLLIVADQYGLNPFLKEIYAYPDKDNGIVPVVGVDGWLTIINNHPQFTGMEFRFAETTIELKGLSKPVFEWIECIIYRKDRTIHTPIREYMDEIYREPFTKNSSSGPYTVTGPWQTHTRRLARHKAIIQAARVVLGYSGIYDEDEAERILETKGLTQSVTSFEFSSEPQSALTTPKAQDELMSDLANADFSGFGVEEAEFVQVEQGLPEQQTNQASLNQVSQDDTPKPNEYVNTRFGEVSRKDAVMIQQMVDFTKESGAWDTTKASFNERYKDATLQFALSELNSAFNEEFSE